MRLRYILPALVVAIVCQCSANAQHGGVPLTPELKTVYQHAIDNEKTVYEAVIARAPVVETYMQGTVDDPLLHQVPNGDRYLLSRIQLGKEDDTVYISRGGQKRRGLSSQQMVHGIDKLLGVSNGYVSTILPTTASSFDTEQNTVTYLGRQFLGDVRTIVFGVAPHKGGSGGFLGRIWVDEQTSSIVRMNGINGANYQFDSWRLNVLPNLWLPAYVYLEDDGKRNERVAHHFHAQIRIWGYSLKLPLYTDESETVTIDDVTDDRTNAVDMSPLEAKRDFEEQGAQNLQKRLFESGLVAAPSAFDKVLEQVTNNLIVGAHLQLPAIHCRVLLTTPLESTTAGNTILISKGMIDTLPDEEHLAMMLSFQLAHIALGHETRFRSAFANTLFFDDTDVYAHVTLNHTPAENKEAADKAVEIMQASIYKDSMPKVALYLNQLTNRAQPLSALLHPRLGDGLFTADDDQQLWLNSLLVQSPPLQVENLTQIAALPLNSQIKVNPWDDTVQQLLVRQVALRTPADKLPFEITPISLRLTRARAVETETGAN